MPAVPVLRPREVIGNLETLGFAEVRQRGSHKRFRHSDGCTTTVLVHPGRDLSPILLRQITRDVGLTAHDFVAYRR
ncbi:MAG: type II toxin-antitoxin system HicA family toxin [Chloroflexi bacterium]|nr:type II toxin-antitoxin system HicA family toxin [Chloroflexota bacterium]